MVQLGKEVTTSRYICIEQLFLFGWDNLNQTGLLVKSSQICSRCYCRALWLHDEELPRLSTEMKICIRSSQNSLFDTSKSGCRNSELSFAH